jgi:hypothetical protein
MNNRRLDDKITRICKIMGTAVLVLTFGLFAKALTEQAFGEDEGVEPGEVRESIESLVEGLIPGKLELTRGDPGLTGKSDLELKADVRQHLTLVPLVDPGDIRIRVEDGVVTLDGDVRHPLEHILAVYAAADAGAVWVVDRLGSQRRSARPADSTGS